MYDRVLFTYEGDLSVSDIVVWQEGLLVNCGMMVDIADEPVATDPILVIADLTIEALKLVKEYGKAQFYEEELVLANQTIHQVPYSAVVGLKTESGAIDLFITSYTDLVNRLANISSASNSIIEQLKSYP